MAGIRFGIIGTGGMGTAHLRYLVKMRSAKLTAVCDIVEERVKAAADEAGAKPFLDYRDLIDSGLVDAVLVATPHYHHPPISIYAMKRGLHVISEKPLGVTLTPVDELIRTAKKTGVKFAVMFQQRARPACQRARQMIRRGEIGDVLRVLHIQPTYRSGAYFLQDAWRATWAEEGGGVLINQAPHATDMLWYLAGTPKTILGRVRTKLHQIEVEDEAEAILEYPNGATGYYYTCTTEVGGQNIMRICGNKGIIEINGNSVRLGKLKTSLTRFDRANKEPWATPEVTWREIRCAKPSAIGHRAITDNFIKAIHGKAKLLSPGVEGIHQVEITCAIILSSYTGKPITLPVSRKAYDQLMARLIRTAKGKKTKRKGIRHTGEVKVFH